MHSHTFLGLNQRQSLKRYAIEQPTRLIYTDFLGKMVLTAIRCETGDYAAETVKELHSTNG